MRDATVLINKTKTTTVAINWILESHSKQFFLISKRFFFLFPINDFENNKNVEGDNATKHNENRDGTTLDIFSLS